MSAADRRAAILDAALDAFSEGGYHETSLDTVAERAGISKALIYEHFSSKRELHGALLETYVGELMERVTEAITDAEAGEQRLRAGADAFLRFVEQRREAWRMLVHNPGEPDVEASVGRMQEQAAETITELMAADAPPDRFDNPAEARLAVEMLAQQLVGALRALANWWDDHRDVSRERVLETLMEFAWLGFDRLSQGQRWASESPA
ncbi:MAG: TetR/AcrR family transcriptional regulator [Actinomycetota bacterium]